MIQPAYLANANPSQSNPAQMRSPLNDQAQPGWKLLVRAEKMVNPRTNRIMKQSALSHSRSPPKANPTTAHWLFECTASPRYSLTPVPERAASPRRECAPARSCSCCCKPCTRTNSSLAYCKKQATCQHIFKVPDWAPGQFARGERRVPKLTQLVS
jgi:hypothetical protein